MTIALRDQLPTLRGRQTQAAAAHRLAYRRRLTSLSTETVKCGQRQGHCQGDGSHLVAIALLSMLNRFCYRTIQETGRP